MKSINYLRGVTRVQVSGKPKEILNRVSSQNILIWSAAETEDGTEFYIHTKNLRQILALYPDAEVSGRGIPEKLKSLRKRAVLPVLSFVLFCLWVVSGQLVWEFNVSGNENVDEFEILRVLDENGVSYGSVGVLIDSEKLSNIVLYEIPELSWFAVNVKGSRAFVSVRERVPVPEIVNPNDQRSVYAEKDGLITSIEVYDGTRVAGVGDEVKKGDILVSGITSSYTGMRTEYALARVYARTVYEYTAVMPKTFSGKIYTGKSSKICGVEVCGRRFELKKYPEGEYERSERTRQIVFAGTALPIKLVSGELTEYELYSKELTAMECAEILKDELSAVFRLESSGEILWSDFEVTEDEKTVTVTLRAHCHERIA